MKRIVNAMGNLTWGKGAYVFVLYAMTAIGLPAQTFTTLYSFCSQTGCTDGRTPEGVLAQGTDGNFYGTTSGGGANLGGTIYKITPTAALTTLHALCSKSGCADGSGPQSGPILATNGDLYGTTVGGGSTNSGTIYRITPTGRLTTLYSFCTQSGCADGYSPVGGLVQATNGEFYGTTDNGGAGGAPPEGGTIFKWTVGQFATLYSFCVQSGCPNGSQPGSGLVEATNGDFYATTPYGGANSGNCSFFYGCGTVFKITPTGTLTTLYSFCAQSGCTDGYEPQAALVQASNDDLYGTTASGGAHGGGTVFKITPTGTLTTLHSFCARSGCTDGTGPAAETLVQATDGNLYGETFFGGANGAGTIFKITPTGRLTTLYSFCAQSGCTDGGGPQTGLVQATNGDFYGTTTAGGTGEGVGCGAGCGTVFSLSVGLGPFVKTLPTSGKVGAVVTILGTNLTGATIVTFNGTAAAFTVVSPSEISTAVPAGATAGKVQVVTPGGTLSSNVPFRVR
jgi:uncharacterized repeat protein (TIGR03803 family)